MQQRHIKNAVWNTEYGIDKYCREGDIVMTISTGDWLIGRQVLQLVNSIYQAGNYHNGKYYQVWATYFNYIREQGCCPSADVLGTID